MGASSVVPVVSDYITCQTAGDIDGVDPAVSNVPAWSATLKGAYQPIPFQNREAKEDGEPGNSYAHDFEAGRPVAHGQTFLQEGRWRQCVTYREIKGYITVTGNRGTASGLFAADEGDFAGHMLLSRIPEMVD